MTCVAHLIFLLDRGGMTEEGRGVGSKNFGFLRNSEAKQGTAVHKNTKNNNRKPSWVKNDVSMPVKNL